MINLSNVKGLIVKKTGRPLAILSKHSPQILLAAGVVGVVASTVLACKATLKVDAILDEAEENLGKIKKASEDFTMDKYTPEDAQKDTVLAYVQTGVALAKLYAPAIGLGVLSIGLILKSNNILQKRNLAVMAAYKIVEESFDAYRRRVVEELGTDKDRQFKYGITSEKVSVEVIDDDGKKKTIKQRVDSYAADGVSEYARFFDELSIQYKQTPEYNLMFLRAQENYANDCLRMRGHVFLNEVYDNLGIPRTQAGAVVGWVRDAERDGGDGYITFGIYDPDHENSRAFVNGYNQAILLDFNVDGVIWDLI